MSKQTIKFQPVHPDPPTKNKVYNQSKRRKPTDELPLKIYLNNLAVGFIRISPTITIFIKGTQLPGKFSSLNVAKAQAINYIADNLK